MGSPQEARRLTATCRRVEKVGTPDAGRLIHSRRTPMRTARVLLTALLAAQPVVAQTPRSGSAWRLDSSTFTRLRTRVSSQDSVRVHGNFGTAYLRQPTLTRDSLLGASVPSGTPRASLALVDVTRIQVRGNASGTGAIVGAGAGFAGGLALALGVAASLCSDGGCTNEAGGVAVITAGSTVAGSLLGALVGTQFKKWHTAYRAP